MSIKKVLSILKMNCACAGIIGLITIGLGIGLGILVILNLIIIFEGCIGAVTSVWMLCQLNKKTPGFVCPTPWHFDSYDEAMVSMRTDATTLYTVTIAGIVLYGIVVIVGSMISGAAK